MAAEQAATPERATEAGAADAPPVAFPAPPVAFTTMTAILGSIGQDEIASHQIALAVIRVSFLPGVAVSEAASVLIGQALGKIG